MELWKQKQKPVSLAQGYPAEREYLGAPLARCSYQDRPWSTCLPLPPILVSLFFASSFFLLLLLLLLPAAPLLPPGSSSSSSFAPPSPTAAARCRCRCRSSSFSPPGICPPPGGPPPPAAALSPATTFILGPHTPHRYAESRFTQIRSRTPSSSRERAGAELVPPLKP